MWIQTTVGITREEAEEKALKKLHRNKWIFHICTDNALEEYIEEEFYYYHITKE